MLMTVLTALAIPPTDTPLPVDRTLQVVPEGSLPEQFAFIAERLDTWTIDLAGVEVDGPFLAPLANAELDSFTRTARETFRRAVDPQDLVYFFDDVLNAEERRGEMFHVHVGRARKHGLVLHPDDVFRGRPRVYPKKRTLAVDVPVPQTPHDVPAVDGDLPGPNWTARYRNPSDREGMIASLKAQHPSSDFAERIDTLLTDLETEGAEIYLASTTRSRERGYLMWGAFTLSRAKNRAQLEERLAVLADRNKSWGLNIPITWSHPDGWEATRDAARTMADTYDVVYATEKGAKNSNHYGGKAADLIAIDLPRRLTLTAPDGATRSFDLSGNDESRDLSLTPRLIEWVATHYGLRKLNSDYPHWNDAKK